MNKKTTNDHPAVTVSAPGKIHLMGEHAVVYGKPALLAAINRRIVVTVSDNSTGVIIDTKEEIRLVERALECVCQRFAITNPNVTIKIVSAVPAGRHAGSSAALAVATVGALVYFFKQIWNPNLINELAFEVEKFQHGTPSGGDNTTCTFGGFIWFRRELEFLKTVWQLPFAPSPKLAPFYLVDTGRPSENTGDMVALVRKFLDEFRDNGTMLLSQNEQATCDVAVAVKEGNEPLLIDALRRGEKTLEGLGVVSAQALPFINDIEGAGGAAKILGGGGKKGAVGLMLVYGRDRKKIEAIAAKYRYVLEDVRLGEEGVRLETGRKHGAST